MEDPDPQDPDNAECPRCHDTGEVPGTYLMCECTGFGGQQRWKGPV